MRPELQKAVVAETGADALLERGSAACAYGTQT